MDKEKFRWFLIDWDMPYVIQVEVIYDKYWIDWDMFPFFPFWVVDPISSRIPFLCFSIVFQKSIKQWGFHIPSMF